MNILCFIYLADRSSMHEKPAVKVFVSQAEKFNKDIYGWRSILIVFNCLDLISWRFHQTFDMYAPFSFSSCAHNCVKL